MTISYCMTYADFDQNQNNHQAQFTVSWQGDNSVPLSVSGPNIFTQQNASCTNQIPSFVVSSPQKPQDTQLVYYLVDVNGQKEIVSKEKFDKELKQVTDHYVQSAQSYFKADMHALAPAINQAILQGTINTPEMRNQLTHQAITHIVMTAQTQLGLVSSFSNHPWVANKDLSDASFDDKIMINYVISRLAYCNNSKTIELAQGCLRAFDDAQKSGAENERAAYQEIYRSCYSELLNNANIKPKVIALHENSMQQDLVDLYYRSGEMIDAIEVLINAHTSIQSNGYHEKYLHRLVEREAVVLKTLQNNPFFTELTDMNFGLSTEVAGYLMAHNINYAAFNNQNCIYFQHLLTNQIVDLLEKNIEMAGHNSNHMIAQYIQHTCHLAVSAQQLNQDCQIMQAVSLADVSEFFTVLGNAVIDCTRDIVVGVGVGTGRSLHSWVVLAYNLTIAPLQTMQEGVETLKTAAYVCGQVAVAVTHCLQSTQLPNMQDLTSSLHYIDDISQLPPPQDPYADMYQKYQSVKTGCLQAVDSAIPVIESILQRPAQENIADVTQCIVDGLVIDGIGKALSYGAQFAKSYLSGAAATMTEFISPDVMHETLTFATTSTGEVIACMEKTGQAITDGMLSTVAGIVDGGIQAAKYIAQGKMLSDKVQQLTNADKAKIEAFQKELEPFLRCDKIINIERLKSIEGIEQIDNFKRYTNNFTNLEKLTSEEILYLNLCDWLEPQATKINARLKDIGGLKFINPSNNAEIIIERYDLFHSLLGEMRPGSIRDHTKGGHLLITELKAAVLEIGEMKSFGNGFFDINIKPINSTRDFKLNSYFPVGTFVDEAADIIDKAIRNPKVIEFADNIKNKSLEGFKFIDQENQAFMLLIENRTAQFFPLRVG